MTQKEVYARLNEEVIRSGKTAAEFVSELDKQARPKLGMAYAFGLVVAAYTKTYNKETVMRYIRNWKAEHRAKG